MLIPALLLAVAAASEPPTSPRPTTSPTPLTPASAASDAPDAPPHPSAPSLTGALHVAGPRVDPAASPLLIEVWATWCGPCHATFPLLSELAARDDLAVVALTDEDPLRVRRFVDRHRATMRFTVWTDPTSALSQALVLGGFGASGIPSTYRLEDGRVVCATRGGPAGCAPAEEAVDEAAAEAVRDGIDGDGPGRPDPSASDPARRRRR